MPTVEWIRIAELIVALGIAIFLFVWVRPSLMRAAATGAAGLVGGLFAWTAGIYLVRWGIWTYIGDLANPSAGDWFLDLMGVPLKVPTLGLLVSVCCCLLVDLPGTTATGGRLQRMTDRGWTALVIGATGLLGAMATTLNAGLDGSIRSGVGSLTFFAALPLWLCQAGVALLALWAVSGLLEPGRAAAEE